MHRLWGKIYFWAMAFVAASAVVLALARPTLFLALVGIFSFYLAFLGYRIPGMKKTGAAAMDWGVAIFTLLACSILVAVALLAPSMIQGQTVPGVVFGVVGILAALRSIATFRHRPADKMYWWYQHMGGMLGSYIAAWSAFSVNILSRYAGPHWWVWLWPTILGTPAILIWIGYYRRRFNPALRA